MNTNANGNINTRLIKYYVRHKNISPAYLAMFREVFDEVNYLSPRIYKEVSRYKNVRQITEDDGKTHHETVNQNFIDSSTQDAVFIVDIETTNRLDIVSQYCYSTPKYWWVIAQANYIIDPFDVPFGTALRIPPLSSLYNKGGILYG